MSRDVIIGTGLSGRGYLNRLLYLSREEAIFLDRGENPIRQLRKEPSYTIRSGSEREPLRVDNYTVYTITDERAIANIVRAKRVFISVDTDHVAKLLPFLQAALQERDKRSLNIPVAKSGIQPSSPLAALRSDSRIYLSEAVIFCTALGQRGSPDTPSENPDHLPYNSTAPEHELPLYDFAQETYPSDLLERGVYMYSCISACVAHLGHEKRYMGYTEAVNDTEVTEKIEWIAGVINRCITTVYNISMQEQTVFSRTATRKLQSRNIKDTTARNVRDVEGKLKPGGRIRKPLSLIQEQGEYSRELLEVPVATLRCGMKTKELLQGWDRLMNLYTQGMCEEWKQVLHHRKRSGCKTSTIRMKAVGSLGRKV